MFDLVRKIVKIECTKKWDDKRKPLLLSLVNCLYEAKDFVFKFISDGSSYNHKLNFAYTMINRIDIVSLLATLLQFAVATAINSHCTSAFALLVTRAASLWLKDSPNVSTLTPNYFLTFAVKTFTVKAGACHILELLENTTVISNLTLSGNAIGNDGLSTLCEALLTNTSLTLFFLRGCSISWWSRSNPSTTEN